MKKLLLLAASLMFTIPAMAQEEPKQEQSEAAKKELQQAMQKFRQLFPQMVGLKDADAVKLAAEAKANDGKLNITADQAVKLVKKWEIKAKKIGDLNQKHIFQS